MQEDLKLKRKFKFLQLRWKEPLGRSECPYAFRWILNFGPFAFRLHKWIRSDDKRYFHDHPFSFVTIIIKGSYVDLSESEGSFGPIREKLTFGSIRFRRAEHRHYVEVPKSGALSFLITGPIVKVF